MNYYIKHKLTGRYLAGYLPTHNLRWGAKCDCTAYSEKRLANKAIRDCHLNREHIEIVTV